MNGFTVSDQTWAQLDRLLSTAELIDLLLAVGQYTLTCFALNSIGVPREAVGTTFKENSDWTSKM